MENISDRRSILFSNFVAVNGNFGLLWGYILQFSICSSDFSCNRWCRYTDRFRGVDPGRFHLETDREVEQLRTVVTSPTPPKLGLPLLS